MARPKVSAILIVWNGMQFLPDCMRTLLADLQSIEHEIIAVDNGSTDGSADFITNEYPTVKLTRNSSNLGFAKAVNQGIEMSTGENLLLLNQDIRIRPGAVSALLKRLEADSKIGLIGPRFVGFDGVTQHSARSFPGIRHVWYKFFLLSELFPNHHEFGSWKMGWFDHESEREVDQPMGAAMLIRRDLIERVGKFDEQFPIFFNDVDFCRRVKDAGYKLLYYPGAVIEHYVGGSTRRYPVRMKWESHRSMYRYLSKYCPFYLRPALWLTGLILLLGVIPALLFSSRKAT
jgi:GT2 family glycosyltransferase